MTPSTTEHIVTTTIATSGPGGMTYRALRDALSYPTNLAEIIARLARLGTLPRPLARHHSPTHH